MNPPNTSPESICAEIEELVAAYALGAADPDERRLVEANLPRCPKARLLLQEYQEISNTMLFSSPTKNPPAHLGDQIRQAISLDARSNHARTANGAPSGGGTQSWLARLLPYFRARQWQPAPLLFALLFLGMIAGFSYMGWQVAELRQTNIALQRTLEEQANLLDYHTDILVLFGAGNTRRVELPALSSDLNLLAAVLYDPDRPELFIYVEDFPPLPPDQVYQVWLIRGETRTSGGTFIVDHYGNGVHFAHIYSGIDTFEEIGITPEPIGGSPGPTAPPVVRGALARLD